MASVPSLKGLSEATARNVLDKAELKAAVKEVPANPAQDGIVVDQAPGPGTLQPPGSVVTIAVGRAPVVPNVIGLPVARARSVLANAGLGVNEFHTRIAFPPNDNVVSQIPPPGTRVAPGSAVRIEILVCLICP
jgi:beta-lactam-binding protein with PASTA domain